jgi:acetoacetate decarboxylase
LSPFDPTAVQGTPYGSPLVPPLPLRMRRVEILTVVYRTDREAADALIPSPLRLASDLCVVQVYRMHDSDWFGVYCESAFQLPVELPDGTPAVYSPFLVLESDGAVAAGRELYGQPKKQGQVSLAPDGDLLVGRVSRNGIDVATATMVWKQRPAPTGALEAVVAGSATNVNLRVLPEGDDGLRRELVVRTFADVVEHEAWEGPATLELRPNAQVPVHLLRVYEVVLGLHRTLDLTLPPGRVVHRYPGRPTGPTGGASGRA